ncbi:MAG: TetR/AcrR family transcriptional regulator [Mycobacterium sp.]
MTSQAEANPKTVRTRRRGKTLEHALYEAILAELTAVGYGRLTMEGIAARAHTGKAALYRRWSNKHDLVQAALLYALPPIPELRAGRSARENLLTMFTAHRDILAGKTAFPGLAIIGQVIHEPELRAIFADAVVAPRLRLIESILQGGVRNGEIDPAALTPLTARVGPALINQHVLLTGAPPGRRELTHIVDTVIAHPAP